MQLIIHEINHNIFLFGSYLLGSIPFLFKNNEVCWIDDDCPYFMKCCYDGFKHYCCSPNKYIKYVPVYVKNK